MIILLKLFYSILFIWLWYLMLKYRRIVKSWTWNFVWAERYLWSWWTYFVLVLIWAFLIFYWVVYPFWWLEILFPVKK